MHTPTRTHSHLASGAALSAAVLAATLAPMPALAGPGEGALGLDIDVVKVDSATGEELDGAVFEISTDIGEAHIVTEAGVDFDYGWAGFRSTCDLPSWEEPGADEAMDACQEAFLQEAYGDFEIDTVTATNGFRVFSAIHSGGWPPYDSGTIVLTEVSAPDGYLLDPEPIVITFAGDAFDFSVSGPEDVTIDAPERGSYTQRATVTIPNDPEPEPEPTTPPPAPPEPTPPMPSPVATTPPAPAPASEPVSVSEPRRAGPVVQTGASGDVSTWSMLRHHIHSFASSILD